MRVDSLHVRNFKGFEDRSFEFPERFTLIVGENGSGKTSVIEALALTLNPGPVFADGDTDLPKSIRDREELIRVKRTKHGEVTRFQRFEPSEVGAHLKRVAGKSFHSRYNLGVHIGTWEWQHYLAKSLSDLNVSCPVLAVFSSNRLPEARRIEVSTRHLKPMREDAFRTGLDGKFAIPDVLAWLRDEQYASLQEGKESLLFRTVTDAMVSCLPGAKKIEYVIREYDVIVEFENGDAQPFRNLSDGQRIILWLVADIAYRAAWLNPHLEDRVLQETDGIVLVDELDLHLHPKWQRHVVDDLKRTFPKIQFIATSHSPFIIQSLEPGELLSLDGDPPIEYANRGLEEIARFVQGVDMPYTSERYVKQKKAAEQYFRMLREGRKADDAELLSAKAELDQYTAHFADNPAADAFMELQRIAKQGSNGS